MEVSGVLAQAAARPARLRPTQSSCRRRRFRWQRQQSPLDATTPQMELMLVLRSLAQLDATSLSASYHHLREPRCRLGQSGAEDSSSTITESRKSYAACFRSLVVQCNLCHHAVASQATPCCPVILPATTLSFKIPFPDATHCPNSLSYERCYQTLAVPCMPSCRVFAPWVFSRAGCRLPWLRQLSSPELRRSIKSPVDLAYGSVGNFG